MRFTNKLCAQHLGWMFKKHWQVQGKTYPRDTGAEAELEKLAIGIKSAQDVIQDEKTFTRFASEEQPVTQPSSKQPFWHEKSCHIFGKNNVLLEGLPQAQILTNTLEITSLPKKIINNIDKTQFSSSVDKSVQNCIIAAQLLDSEQVKLRKVKHPERRTINMPRVYGVSNKQRNRVLVTKLISECERLGGHSLASQRKVIDNINFKVTLSREDDQIQISSIADKMIVSNRALEEIKGSYSDVLPDLYPLKCTISIPTANVYNTDNICPFNSENSWGYPHTILSYFDADTINNLHGTNVSSTQIQSRTLLNAFCVAAARAQQLYGASVWGKKLEKPIVIQSVQTDGRVFHFGVFQLNTLALASTETTKNYWFHQPNLELYSRCAIREGKPTTEDYNSDVFRLLYALYNNV